MTLNERQRLVATLPLDEAIGHDDQEGIRAAEARGYHPYLKVFPNGHRCMVPGCGYCCIQKSTMKDYHQIGAHGRAAAAQPRPYQTSIYVSTLWSAPYRHYLQVHPPTVFSTGDNPSDEPTAGGAGSALTSLSPDHLSRRLDQLQSARQKAHQQLAVAPPAWEPSDLTVWDQRTQWPAHFAGLDMEMIARAALLTLPTDPPCYQTVLSPAIHQLVLRCHLAGPAHTTHVRRIIRSLNANDLSPKPLRFVDPGTVGKYVIVWEQLILYLLRQSPFQRTSRCLARTFPYVHTPSVILDLSNR